MKIGLRLLYVIILLILFSSCEEIVNVDLRSADPMNVIDAKITQDGSCMVVLTKSQAFRNNDSYERISGAVIELSDSDGNTEILDELAYENGIYLSKATGVVGRTYYLKVTIDDDVYEASATIPEAVHINKVYIYAITAGTKSWYSPSFTFNDPPGVDNYYYTILKVNDMIMKTIYLHDDEYRDGMEIHRILFFNDEDNGDEPLDTGDYLHIEMQALDKGMYTYYKSLSTVAEGSNPITNFTGKVLGCFKAYNSSYADAIVSYDILYSDK